MRLRKHERMPRLVHSVGFLGTQADVYALRATPAIPTSEGSLQTRGLFLRRLAVQCGRRQGVEGEREEARGKGGRIVSFLRPKARNKPNKPDRPNKPDKPTRNSP